METAIEAQEAQRKAIWEEMGKIGDMRRGSITETYRKCGKKNCGCAEKDHRGHGRYQWSARIEGKSYAKTLPLGMEMEKYRKEIGNHRKFVELSKRLVEVCEKICDERPIEMVEDETELSKLKKKLQRSYKAKWKRKSGE